MFSRLADDEEGIPRFSIKGGTKYLFYEYDGYSGGHEILDRIIGLLKSYGIRPYTTESDSPLNVSSYETEYDFADGGLRIYSGNAFFDSKHGAYIFGFRALRWIIHKLHLPQPRRFKREISGKQYIFHGDEGEQEGLTRVASAGIDFQFDWEPGFEVFGQVQDFLVKFGKLGKSESIDLRALVGDHHYFDGSESACFPPLRDDTDFEQVFEEFHFIKLLDEPATKPWQPSRL